MCVCVCVCVCVVHVHVQCECVAEVIGCCGWGRGHCGLATFL